MEQHLPPPQEKSLWRSREEGTQEKIGNKRETRVGRPGNEREARAGDDGNGKNSFAFSALPNFSPAPALFNYLKFFSVVISERLGTRQEQHTDLTIII